ncbi:hypothetical protein [Enterobacter soli]|uniref:hypothetical protein n=1 Tax=Enterobacter soli TaxID=885040 RepID=UPI0028A06FAA|nr:hypothetical protein [Enterobacter soli]
MGKMTFVVEFEEGEEPAISAGIKIAGGRLCAVSWIDYRNDYFSPEQRDIVIESLNELTRDEIDAECHEEIINKVDLLTF